MLGGFMFLVFSKEKICTYIVSILTVFLLFFVANTMKSDNFNAIATSSNDEKLLPIYNVQTQDKKISLTMNCAWNADDVDKILEILKNNQVKATFFITAHYVNTQEELVKQMIEEGHIVGNHTVNHKSMPDLSEEKIKKEILELHQTIYDKFNYEMKYMRPPKGEFSEKSLSVTNSLGYKTVMWSFAYEDWNEDKQPEEEKSKAKILNNLHNGEIMLLHGNSKTNTNILDSIIKEAKQMGYEFKSLDEFQN